MFGIKQWICSIICLIREIDKQLDINDNQEEKDLVGRK